MCIMAIKVAVEMNVSKRKWYFDFDNNKTVALTKIVQTSETSSTGFLRESSFGADRERRQDEEQS